MSTEERIKALAHAMKTSVTLFEREGFLLPLMNMVEDVVDHRDIVHEHFGSVVAGTESNRDQLELAIWAAIAGASLALAAVWEGKLVPFDEGETDGKR
jgi:hypothetical protein